MYLSVMNRWEILEPHWLILFFTWMSRFRWDHMFPLLVRLGSKVENPSSSIRSSEHYFPYTKSMLKNLIKELELESDDITSFYA